MKHLPRGEEVLPLLALSLFVLLFVAEPLADVGVLRRPLLSMFMLIVMLAGMFALHAARRLTIPLMIIGGMAFVLQAATLLWPPDALAIANDIAAGLFVLLLSGLLLNYVMGPGRITGNRITGAIGVYLLIALVFALLYDLLERLSPGAFVVGSEALRLTPAGGRFFYLSIITVTSVGFGDMSPVHPFARSLVMIEAVGGHIYTAVLLARLVSLEVAYRIGNSS
jgi:hypothetical protein